MSLICIFNKTREFIGKHFDFRVYWVTLLSVLVGLSIYPVVTLVSPDSKIGYENGLLENLQMVLLFAGCLVAVRSKVDKKFFYFIAMVLGILILREVNCGRTLFFPIPGVENAFYSWKEIKYGWLAHPLYGLYIAWVVFYFLKNKLYMVLWRYLLNKSHPVWDFLLLYMGIGLSLYAEKATENFVFEEMSELLLYVSVFGLILLYTVVKSSENEGG